MYDYDNQWLLYNINYDISMVISYLYVNYNKIFRIQIKYDYYNYIV